MTDKDYKEMLKAMEEHHQWLLSDKKAAKKYLKQIGFWQLTVPIKPRKETRGLHRKK